MPGPLRDEGRCHDAWANRSQATRADSEGAAAGIGPSDRFRYRPDHHHCALFIRALMLSCFGEFPIQDLNVWAIEAFSLQSFWTGIRAFDVATK